MDIELPKMNGFETIKLYKETNNESKIIILTAHTKLARKGYLVDAFRFIDKTKMNDELDEAFKKILNDVNSENSIFVEQNNKIIKLKLNDILYIETYKRGTIIHTQLCEYGCKHKINELESKLKEYNFFRCHKSFLINLILVEKIDNEFAYFTCSKVAYISVRKYSETKRKFIKVKNNNL